MAQAGYTPIQLYYSTTASAIPTAGNLAAGELALNTLDEKLYFKNSSGVVKLLASTTGVSGTVSTVSVVSANGLAGTVANPTTTPAITLSTTVTGLLKGNGTAIQAATSGLDYAPATSGTSILKGNGTGGFNNASSGLDYAPPTSGTSILYGNGAGGFSNVTIGSGLNFATGTLTATGSGGSVTSVSVVSGNGFAGTVANASTTPAITLSTTISGVLKGNGTAIQAATSGLDYAPATSGSSILYGNGSGGFSNVTVGSGLNFSGGTLTATGGTGTVTSVGVSFSSGLISVSNSPVTGIGTIALSVAGTSGGIPYFTSTNAWASSGTLASGALVIGGGAGVAPSTTTTGTGVLTALANPVGNVGSFVTNGGALGTPSSATLTNATNLPINAGTSGTLPVNRGGTGQVTLPSGSVLIGNGTGGVSSVAPGANNQVLTSNGVSWVSAAISSGVTLISNGNWSGVTAVSISGISSTYKYYQLVINNWNSQTWSGTSFLPIILVNTTIATPDTSTTYYSQSSLFTNATGYAQGSANSSALLSQTASYGASVSGGYSFSIFIDAKYAVSSYGGTYYLQGSVLGGVPLIASTISGHFGWYGFNPVTGIYLSGGATTDGTYYLYGFNSP